MAPPVRWRVSGTYYEACNCEPVCPCRRLGNRSGGRSTYGNCDFALSWRVAEGEADGVALNGLGVVMAGTYDDDEPGQPWRVSLYVDDRANAQQHAGLSDIFLGRAGGTVLSNFAAAIGEVHAVRTARISLDHRRGREAIEAADWVTVSGVHEVEAPDQVSCGIPGHDHPGREVRADVLRVADGPLRWEVTGRCGFAADFAYVNDTG